jgi:hypothetical protein
MVWHGLHAVVAKAAPTVVNGVVGVAAYEALRKVTKAPLRAATVSATAWALRVAHEAERKAEKARLTAADVLAEAVERVGEDEPPPAPESVPTKTVKKAAKAADACH